MNRKQRRRQEKARRKTGGPRPETIPILDQAYAHQRAGRLAEAVAHYERALVVDPGYGPALNNLGVALKLVVRDGLHLHRRTSVRPIVAVPFFQGPAQHPLSQERSHELGCARAVLHLLFGHNQAEA